MDGPCSDDADLEEEEEGNSEINSVIDGRCCELMKEGRTVVFTDGACTNNQDDRFRRAGYGAYWADASPLNVSKPLHGWVQTNQRAELQAVLAVLLADKRSLEIRSDSQYVVNGFQDVLAHGHRRHGAHLDLWGAIADNLAVRPKHDVKIVK
eukprot:9440995-Karenia_brevis.AAC.1